VNLAAGSAAARNDGVIMRSLTALLGALSLLVLPRRVHADRQSAESYLETARQLAAHGHCDEALRLRPVIEHLDPELARTRFASDPAIAACPGMPPVTAPAPPSCGPLGGYVEPSLFAAAGSPGVGLLGRVAVGFRLIRCEADAHEGITLRVGGTFSLRTARLGLGASSGIGGSPLYPAGGGELEVTVPIGDRHIGLRAGLENDDGLMTTVGLRLRDGSAVYALDGFFDSGEDTTQTHGAGLMLGLGGDVHLGAGGLAATLGPAALITIVTLSILAGSN
jgi:hypothetical protein